MRLFSSTRLLIIPLAHILSFSGTNFFKNPLDELHKEYLNINGLNINFNFNLKLRETQFHDKIKLYNNYFFFITQYKSDRKKWFHYLQKLTFDKIFNLI